MLIVRARYVGMIWLPRALSILCTVQYGSLFPAKSKTNPEFSTHHSRDLCIFFFHMAKRSTLALAFASAEDSQSKKKRKTDERGKEKNNGKKKVDIPNTGPYCREAISSRCCLLWFALKELQFGAHFKNRRILRFALLLRRHNIVIIIIVITHAVSVLCHVPMHTIELDLSILRMPTADLSYWLTGCPGQSQCSPNRQASTFPNFSL